MYSMDQVHTEVKGFYSSESDKHIFNRNIVVMTQFKFPERYYKDNPYLRQSELWKCQYLKNKYSVNQYQKVISIKAETYRGFERLMEYKKKQGLKEKRKKQRQEY